jgi:hypothetical protein
LHKFVAKKVALIKPLCSSALTFALRVRLNFNPQFVTILRKAVLSKNDFQSTPGATGIVEFDELGDRKIKSEDNN